MPRGNYSERLSDEDIINLFLAGKYRADLSTGNIYSGKTGKRLFTFSGSFRNTGYRKDKNYRWVRLFCSPKYRTLPVSHVIWIVGSGASIPPGFEIHHDNENRRDNSFDNLLCVHNKDHKKLHRIRRQTRQSLVLSEEDCRKLDQIDNANKEAGVKF